MQGILWLLIPLLLLFITFLVISPITPMGLGVSLILGVQIFPSSTTISLQREPWWGSRMTQILPVVLSDTFTTLYTVSRATTGDQVGNATLIVGPTWVVSVSFSGQDSIYRTADQASKGCNVTVSCCNPLQLHFGSWSSSRNLLCSILVSWSKAHQ